MSSSGSTRLQHAQSVPGPVDRVHFLDEQRRRRAQAWRFTALSALVAAVFGIPLAMFLTPLVFLVTMGVLRLLGRTAPVPDGVWSSLRELAQFVPTFLDAVVGDIPDTEVLHWLRETLGSVDYPFNSPLLTVTALILPGMAAMVLIWLGYRALFRSAGVGGALLALGAREPRPDDLEERQLVNLVEEMALAAGLPPPRVRMLDSPIPNGATMGASHDHAVLIVTRGLLDRMDRDETQGVIAHLVGSTGNGDLALMTSITTVFQSLELVFTALEAGFNLSQSAWRDLFWMARLAITGGRDSRAAEIVAHMMDHRIGETREDGLVALLTDSDARKPSRGMVKLIKALPPLWIVALPFLLLYVLALFLRMQVTMFRLVFVAPLLMRVTRARRFLADATAVQLTRYPDGLALALGHLAEEGGPIPGGQWFSHLFIVGPEAARARRDRVLEARLAELRETSTDRSGAPRLSSAVESTRAVFEYMRDADPAAEKTWADELSSASSHPPILKRVQRLVALGARVDPQSHSARTPRTSTSRTAGRLAGFLGSVILSPLLAIVTVLATVALGGILMFGIAAAVAFMGMAMAAIHALLG